MIYSSPKSIGDEAFIACKSLDKFYFPPSIKVIGDSAFKYAGLKELAIPETIEFIKDHCFYGCEKLSKIKILEKGNISLGVAAFGKTAVEDLEIPSSVVNVGDYLISDCKNLKSLTFMPGIDYVPPFLAANCTNLKDVFISDQITSIRQNAFAATGIEKIDKNFSHIKEFGSGAFGSCDKLKTVIIENKSAMLSNRVFSNCKNIVFAFLAPSTIGCDTFGNYSSTLTEPSDIFENHNDNFLLYAPNCKREIFRNFPNSFRAKLTPDLIPELLDFLPVRKVSVLSQEVVSR